MLPLVQSSLLFTWRSNSILPVRTLKLQLFRYQENQLPLCPHHQPRLPSHLHLFEHLLILSILRPQLSAPYQKTSLIDNLLGSPALGLMEELTSPSTTIICLGSSMWLCGQGKSFSLCGPGLILTCVQFQSASVSAKFQEKEYNYRFEYRDIWEWIVSLVCDSSLSTSSHWTLERVHICEGETCEHVLNELYTADAWWPMIRTNTYWFQIIVTATTSRSLSSLLFTLAYMAR